MGVHWVVSAWTEISSDFTSNPDHRGKQPGLGKPVFSLNNYCQTLHFHLALTLTMHFSNVLLHLFSLNYRVIMNLGYKIRFLSVRKI